MLLLLVLVSCQNSREPSFNVVKELDYKLLVIENGEILNPTSLLFINDYLIVNDEYNSNLISLVDIDSHVIVQRALRKGNGPGEYPYDIAIPSRYIDNTFQFYDSNLGTLNIYSIDSLIKSSIADPVERLSTSFIKESKISEFYKINNSYFIAIGSFSMGRFASINYDTMAIKVVFDFDYPLDKRPEHKDETNFIKYDAYQGRFFISPDRKKILYASTGGRNYAIFKIDPEKRILVKLYEELVNLPEYISSPSTGAQILPENIGGYFADVSDNYIYLENFYKPYTDEYSYLTDEIQVYDWNNQPIMKFKLNRQVACISVDEKNKKIYAISFNPATSEPEIGYFEF